ncbi:GspE/PulE family protein [Marinobacterium mangrovicola]|uniref:General secretion pathway protein E n=1 Tax=Marinobacterium mangrovicola TaxID=1476959 RepID=A0A4R1GH67_9GAMM|nr:ATPase, T2SS/T4P/T4SS family [Marinobacterium mangrovicola]TCK03542.1 general secretion pathway protein E [Marinobacterium mangrovicola]
MIEALLNYRVARRSGLCLIRENGEEQLFCSPEFDPVTLQELQRTKGLPSRLEWLDRETFDARLTAVYESRHGDAAALLDGLADQVDLNSLMQDLPTSGDLLDSENEAPVIRLINGLFAEAIRLGASDLHVETFEDAIRVRFRIDGRLREVLQPPRALASMLVSCIKVMAQLDIAEKRTPQDGRIRLRAGGREIDIRVSTLPGIHGERVVMRVLDKQAARLSLDHLGMPEQVLQSLQRTLAQPNGILLSTGPTGSGKTTTLYSCLNELNDGQRNILTVEDPVEYAIPGIGQTPLNPRAGMTFASGLRAILRQDPDVIMIGEVRDQETASIAVQASLTGHLVLSTLHTNSAVGAITRLLDMGLEPFLLASTLKGVMAQRLVRRLCPECHDWRVPSAAETELLPGLDRLEQLPVAVGCDACQGSGYKGRIGLYEFIRVDSELADLIHCGASETALEKFLQGRRQSLVETALARLAAGESSLEEVLGAVQA